ncbi:MAG: alcohol dehydrogenase catalytic domain-containing protein, partial [Lysobacter spongiicola]|nr:alcohol dehydrogenase catalytic domain-containing protein [Lysobacter spongiicola]
MTAMNAAVFMGDGRVAVERKPVPQPGPGQVQVRLQGCGVCASNLPVWEGKPWFDYPLSPGAPGHEGWGEVATVGDGVDDWRPGDRVALLSGNAFAEYDLADATALARIPDVFDGRPV